MANKFQKIQKILSESEKIVITTHLLPDGDAIGSAMALYYYLKKKKKKVWVINHNESPDYLLFLDHKNVIRRFLDSEAENTKIINSSDLIIIADTNEYSRLKSMQKILTETPVKKICIDHHQGIKPEAFAAYYTDTEAPATSEILYEMIASDDVDLIDKNIAECLYAGIMTDTGSFRYPRTTKKTFLIAADLIARGTDPVMIYDRIYNNMPPAKVKLLARFINSFTFHYNNSLVIGMVTLQDFKDFHSDIKDVEGFSGLLMTMKNVKAGILIVEWHDNCKISFRSKGNIKMNMFAKIFGGGGHINAAGATIVGKEPDEIKEKMLEEYKGFMPH